MRATIYGGDCRDSMLGLAPSSVDAIVTDPPYGLEFMGRGWDYGVPGRSFFSAMLEVARPGAHLVAFGGTRLFHRQACAIEEAGWELRDMAMWLYGSGFPKAADVSKMIDRRRDDRADVLKVTAWIKAARDRAGVSNRDIDAAFGLNGMAGHWTSTKSQPQVPTLEQMPTILRVLKLAETDLPEGIKRLIWALNGRKGTPGKAWFDREVVGQGSGVDTKVQSPAVAPAAAGIKRSTNHTFDITAPASPLARAFDGYKSALKPAWEPIIIAMKPLDGTLATNAERHGCAGFNVDGCRVGETGATRRSGETGALSLSGAFTTGHQVESVDAGRYPANLLLDPESAELLDASASTSSAPSRFFYSGKANKSDRRYIDPDTGEERFSDHPTVKPQSLMRWLTRLVLPPARDSLPPEHPLHGKPRVVLDPFLGSGSTGVACVAEGVEHFIGCERVEHFQRISEARLKDAGADTKVVPG